MGFLAPMLDMPTQVGNNGDMTTATYTTTTNAALWILVGGDKCRSNHLTADPIAEQFNYNVTDRTGVEFISLCGKTIINTGVQDYTIYPQSVCKACARKAVQS
jgi:hypothetical protein